jgi:hypothetical protein
LIHEHRGIFLKHAIKRIYFFWISVPHPIEKSLMVEVIREGNFAFLSIGGILGLWLALRQRVPGVWLFPGFFKYADALLFRYRTGQIQASSGADDLTKDQDQKTKDDILKVGTRLPA